MNTSWKKYGIFAAVGVAALVVAFGAGRYSTPAKVEYREKVTIKEVIDQKAIQEAVTKAQSEWQKNEKVKTVTKIVYKEGQVVEKTVYVDRDSNSSGSSNNSSNTTTTVTTHGESNTTTEKVKIVTNQPRFAVGAFALTEWSTLTQPNLVYGAQVNLRLIGNLWAGGMVVPQNKSLGLNLMLTF